MSSNKELVKDLREAQEQVAELQAELKERSGLTRVQVNDILRENESLEAENDRLRKAILTWWRGSPEDTGSEVQLRSVATELKEK
jgi:regulator of replication initiation timing